MVFLTFTCGAMEMTTDKRKRIILVQTSYCEIDPLNTKNLEQHGYDVVQGHGGGETIQDNVFASGRVDALVIHVPHHTKENQPWSAACEDSLRGVFGVSHIP
jgi:hypothetical protein